MSVVSRALTTRTKVKTFLGISDSNSDTVIDEAINYVTDFVESYCGNRRFAKTTYSNEVYDAEGQRDLLLNQWPVTTLTSVEYRTGSVSSPTWVAFNADEYLSYAERGVIGFLSPLPNVRQGLRVSYAAGYLIDFSNEGDSSLHTLPFDIALIATELAAKVVEGRKALGVTTMATEGQSVSFGDAGSALTASHKAILGRYARRAA